MFSSDEWKRDGERQRERKREIFPPKNCVRLKAKMWNGFYHNKPENETDFMDYVH